MNNPREAISEALFTQLQKANGTGAGQFNFQSFERGLKSWGSVPAANQPAAFLVKWKESLTQVNLGLTVYVLDYLLVIYLQVDPSTGTVGETTCNAILDALDLALQSKPPYEKQSLGGLVINAWIEGEVMIDTGILDQQAAIFVPIKVRTGA
jgi:hypothetical protein